MLLGKYRSSSRKASTAPLTWPIFMKQMARRQSSPWIGVLVFLAWMSKSKASAVLPSERSPAARFMSADTDSSGETVSGWSNLSCG